MTRRTQFVTLLSLGSALLLSSHGYAQNSPSGSSEGAGGAAGGGASVSNTETAGGAGGETADVTATTTTTETTETTMANTGGEPWLMALAGSLTAGSALLLRRKLR